MKIVRIDRPTLHLFRQEFEKDLKSLGEKYGVFFSLGSLRYTDKEFHGRLTVVLPFQEKKIGDTNYNPEQSLWNADCQMFGFKPEDFGKTFMAQGRSFKISNLKPTYRRYPVIGTRIPDGKAFKFDVETVKTALKS